MRRLFVFAATVPLVVGATQLPVAADELVKGEPTATPTAAPIRAGERTPEEPATTLSVESPSAPDVAEGDVTTTLTVIAPEKKQRGKDGASVSSAITARELTCDVAVNNPHYSTGAKGVIVKIRYTCSGNMSGQLLIDGKLYRYAPGTVGPYEPRATNKESRGVGPLAVGTVYVPDEGTPGIYCNLNHWYNAAAFITLTAGGSASSATVASNTVHPSRCS